MKKIRKRDIEQHVRELNIQDEKIYKFLIGALNQLMTVDIDCVFDKTRKTEIIYFRHALRYNLKKYTKLKLKTIANITSKESANHATIIHGIEAWSNLIDPICNGIEHKAIQDEVEKRVLDFLRFSDPNKKFYIDGIGFDALHDVSVRLWNEHRIRFDF